MGFVLATPSGAAGAFRVILIRVFTTVVVCLGLLIDLALMKQIH